MSAEVFKQPKTHAACLSAWSVSRVACGDAGVETHASAHHAQACAECARRIEQETQQVRDAAQEPIPLAIFQRRPAAPATPRRARKWRAWPAVAPAIAAAVAILLLRTVPEPLPTHRIKGSDVSLSATVQRDGGVMLDDHPLDDLHVLRQGDRLRLRLAGNVGAWVMVQGLEAGQWTTYYQGPPPADRWLPFGIEVTAKGETRLRMVSCATTPADFQHPPVPPCSERTFNL